VSLFHAPLAPCDDQTTFNFQPKMVEKKNNKMANRIIIIVVRVCEWYSRGFVLSNWFMAILVRCCAVVAVAVAVSVAIGV